MSGIWDGKGDFTITSTGDVYVDLLSLTDKPLDNFKITTETKIEQDATRISLLGKKINGVEGSVTDLVIELNAAEERITAYVNKEIQDVGSSVSQLEITVGNISSTVSSVQGNVSAAQSVANAAKTAADDAAAKALAAQTTANSASSKADANATAISQQADSISLLAGAFTLKDGKYVLTSAAGAVITSEVATIYATKQSVNSIGERVTTAEASIKVNADNINLKVSKNGVVAAINASSESVTISANRIDLSGVVTSTAFNNALAGYATDSELSSAQAALNKSISDLNTSLSSQINAKASTESLNAKVSELNNAISKKADTSSLKAMAYKDVVEAASCGSTLIVGGYLNTDYCKVKTIEATKGTVGGFTINADYLTNVGVGDETTGASISIASADGSRYAALYGGAAPNAAYFSHTSGVAVLVEAGNNSNACGIEINGSGNGEAMRSYGTSTFATKSNERTYISGLSLSVQEGISWTRTSTDNHFAAANNVDFLIVTGSSSIPSANSNKGRILFTKCKGSNAKLTVSGVYLADGTYKSSQTWTDAHSRFFISDGVYWHEFYCTN